MEKRRRFKKVRIVDLKKEQDVGIEPAFTPKKKQCLGLDCNKVIEVRDPGSRLCKSCKRLANEYSISSIATKHFLGSERTGRHTPHA